LPPWLQYTIAILIVLVVLGFVRLSWRLGRGPNPVWKGVIDEWLVPYAGWIGIAAIAFLIVRWLLQRKARG